jgi:hypothetical protein
MQAGVTVARLGLTCSLPSQCCDNVSQPLWGKATCVGEQVERGLELPENGDVLWQVPSDDHAVEQRLEAVQNVEHLNTTVTGPSRSMLGLRRGEHLPRHADWAH